MSTETQDAPDMGTKPLKEHEWLQKLVGEWRTEAEMFMGPDQPPIKATGKESAKMLGDLWVVAEGTVNMGPGMEMEYRAMHGYDVTFKDYRGCRIATGSSHLWKYAGTLSPDGKVLTMEIDGPNMFTDGMAKYRDVIEIVDDNHRILTFYGEDENGTLQKFMTANYTRV